MRIYALFNSADEWHLDVGFYQTVMFHGQAIVPDGRGVASHDYAEEGIEPMRLLVNGYRLGEVFLPVDSANLVLSERVMLQLLPMQSQFSFRPVVFDKVYNLPWPFPGENQVELSATIERFRSKGRELSIAKTAPPDQSAARSLQRYYELVVPNHYSLLRSFAPTHTFFTMWYKTKPRAVDLVPVSKEMFRSAPITQIGTPIVREDIFNCISPYMNHHMFGIKEFGFDDHCPVPK
jgi:hypothetical protein